MGHLAAWYQERPRVVEAVQLTGTASIPDVAEFLGARSWDATEVDVAFYDGASGTLTLSWSDWVVRIHDEYFEVVPESLFVLVFEPSVPSMRG